jgi:hypothetical protein
MASPRPADVGVKTGRYGLAQVAPLTYTTSPSLPGKKLAGRPGLSFNGY